MSCFGWVVSVVFGPRSLCACVIGFALTPSIAVSCSKKWKRLFGKLGRKKVFSWMTANGGCRKLGTRQCQHGDCSDRILSNSSCAHQSNSSPAVKCFVLMINDAARYFSLSVVTYIYIYITISGGISIIR